MACDGSGPRDAPAAGLGAGLLPRLFVLEADRVLALAPRRLRHAQQPLVDVVGHDVVERRGVVADDEDDDAEAVVRHHRHLRVETGQIAAVVRDQMPAIRGGPAAHPVRRVEKLAPAAHLETRVGQRDRRRQRLPDHRLWQDLLAVDLPVVHQRDEPVRHVLDVRVHRAGRRDADRVAVVRDLVQLERVAPLGVRHAGLGVLEHVVDGERRAGHAERREDALANEGLPRLARQQLDRVARRPRTSCCCRGTSCAAAASAPGTSVARTAPSA